MGRNPLVGHEGFASGPSRCFHNSTIIVGGMIVSLLSQCLKCVVYTRTLKSGQRPFIYLLEEITLAAPGQNVITRGFDRDALKNVWSVENPSMN